MSPARMPPGARWLLPLSVLYGWAVGIRNRRYDRPGAAIRAGLPVIGIGNLAVGGTGKTPFAGWLCRELLALGRRPAIVSRGYGGRAGRGPLVVSDGSGPTVDAAICGDEPLMLAASIPGLRVVVGSDRVAGAEAASGLGADVVVLDDGFQHRRLARDLDIVLLDSGLPLDGEPLLPAGRLREPASSLRRAGIVVATRAASPTPPPGIVETVRRHNATCPVLASNLEVAGFFEPSGARVAAPPRAVAFGGIADPEGLRLSLVGAGVLVESFRPFPDHHPFSDREWDALAAEANARGVPLVTTEKDLARLRRRLAARAAPILVLRVESVVHGRDVLLSAVLRAMGRDGS